MTETPVTVHAAQRWLERVEGLDLGAVRRKIAAIDECSIKSISPREVVEYALAETGRTIVDLEAQILTDTARAAMDLGAARHKHPSGVMLIFRTGVVVTVMPLDKPRVMDRSRREVRKGYQRFNRRQKS